MANNLLPKRFVRQLHGRGSVLLLLSATAAFGVYPMWNNGKRTSAKRKP